MDTLINKFPWWQCFKGFNRLIIISNTWLSTLRNEQIIINEDSCLIEYAIWIDLSCSVLTSSLALCKTASLGTAVLCSAGKDTQLWAKPVPSCPIIDLDFDLAGPPWKEWRVIKSPCWLKPESLSLAEIINHLQLSVVALWCGHLLGTEMRAANTIILCAGLSRSRIKGVWTGISGSLYQIQGQVIASHRQGKVRRRKKTGRIRKG